MGSTRNGIKRAALTANDTNVNRLLKELHEKKRWLDVMIQGLEEAGDSPHIQLIANAERIFHRLNGDRPKVDLGPEQQRVLANLASRVARRRSRKSLRHDSKAA